MARIRRPSPSTSPMVRTKKATLNDSPSRQLIFDLERALCQAQIHETELQKLHAYDRRSFQENLDSLDTQKALEDVTALKAVKSRHELVRREAEAELHQHYQEIEEQKRLQRQKQEEQRAREQQAREEAEGKRLAQEEAEARRRAQEEAERKARVQREEAAANRAAAEKQARLEEVERSNQESVARDRAETTRKQREEQEAAKLVQQAVKEAEVKNTRRVRAIHEATTAGKVNQSQGQPLGLVQPNLKHQRYLLIHQNLKKFRKEFWAQCRRDASLKSKVGDMRRGIKTGVGQLTETKGANQQPTERIKSILRDATTIPTPRVDVRDYFATPPAVFQTAEQSQCPSLLIYMLSIFSKAIVSQFGGESGISIKAAEPAGILVAQIFAATDFQLSGNALIDILLAKLHFACPVLWGVYGNEGTEAGRQLLGWRREDGQFVSESRHHERVSGFGAGFASIALRNFTKSRGQNPFPPTNFWECLVNILNVPAGDVQPTHLFVLKAMLENSVERFIQFYGSAAIAALRHSLITFPATLPAKLQDTAACKAITLLADILARQKNLRLE